MPASDFNCSNMPSFWSMNHQALPNWILPGTPPWKQPASAASAQLAEGFKV